jgi:hypothetical protein
MDYDDDPAGEWAGRCHSPNGGLDQARDEATVKERTLGSRENDGKIFLRWCHDQT